MRDKSREHNFWMFVSKILMKEGSILYEKLVGIVLIIIKKLKLMKLTLNVHLKFLKRILGVYFGNLNDKSFFQSPSRKKRFVKRKARIGRIFYEKWSASY